MSQQYYPIILQLGSRFIRAGFAGDAVPIVRRRTNLYDLEGVHISPLGTSHAHFEDFGDEPNESKNDGSQVLWNYDLVGASLDKIEQVLERIIYDIYLTDLLIDPKNCKVLVIEPPFFPVPLKNLISKVLLFHMHAQSVRFFPEPVMTTISSGSHSALVIDMGWNQTTITPVFDLRQLYKYARSTTRAGRWLHEEVRKSLKENGCPYGFEFVERFICEAMYAGIASGSDENMYTFEGHDIPMEVRYELIENVFFPSSTSNEDDNAQSIAELVSQCLHELGIDLRAALKGQIIITGGISHIPGIKSRLLMELADKCGAGGIKSLGAWEGASLYCSTALMSSSMSQDRKRWPELVRDKYLKGESALIDWTDDLYGRLKV